MQIRASIPVFFRHLRRYKTGFLRFGARGNTAGVVGNGGHCGLTHPRRGSISLWPLSNSVPYSRSRLILRRAESQRNCTKVQKCIPVLVHGRRLEIHAGTKLGGDGFVGAVGRIDGRRSKSIRDGKAITENVPSVPIPRFPSRFPQSPILCYEYEGGYCRCTRNGND